MNVLVIAEDPTLDYYLLEPIITTMISAVGKPQAKVRICRDPLYRGVDEVLKHESLQRIIRRHPMVHLFVLCVDRDGEPNRRAALDEREKYCATIVHAQKPQGLIAECAWQELEVWALAGCTDLPNNWRWQVIRDERNAKEVYYDQYVRQKGIHLTPGTGRQVLGRQAAQRYARLRQLCPEDIMQLETRIGAWVSQR